MIILLTLLALLLRLIGAGQSFWLDEGASLMAASVPLSQLPTYLQADFQPPLYYLFLKLTLFLTGSESELLIRLPSILISTLAVPVVYLIVKQMFPKKEKYALLSAFFLTINPLHIYYSAELRMYGLSALLCLLSSLFLLRRSYPLVGLFNLLAFYTFYGTVFFFFGQLIFLFIACRKDWVKFFLSHLPLFLSLILWYPIFSVQLNNGGYIQEKMPGWASISGSLSLKSLFLIPLKFIIGRISFSPPSLYLISSTALVLISSLIILYSIKAKKSFPFIILLFAPLIAAAVVSLYTPLLSYHRFIFSLPFFLIALVLGLYQIKSSALQTFFVCFYSVLFIFCQSIFLSNPQFHREDWRSLREIVSQQDTITVLPFEGVFAPLIYYAPKEDYLPLLPNDRDLSSKIDQALASHKHILVMDYISDLTDPDRVILQTVKTKAVLEKHIYNFNNLGQVFEFQKL